VSKLKNIASKAEKARVTLGFESWLSAEEHLAILDRIGSPAVQVYYDVANSHMKGYDIYKEIRTLGKRICQVHAKDYDDLYGKGSIDFKRVREAMDDAAIALDRDGRHEVSEGPNGLEEGCRYDAEYLRPIFPGAYKTRLGNCHLSEGEGSGTESEVRPRAGQILRSAQDDRPGVGCCRSGCHVHASVDMAP